MVTASGSRKKGGLGRGLASLIPTTLAEDLVGVQRDGGTPPMNIAADVLIEGKDSTSKHNFGASYQEIAIADIEPNPRQPRQNFDEQELAELTHSIKEFGLMQPIVVRRNPLYSPSSSQCRYQIIMGERRWRAAQEAELKNIPAIIKETDDEFLLRDALLENIHRVQLNPLEEASAYQQLLDDFHVTHDELAIRLGRSRPMITNAIRLLKLPLSIQHYIVAGTLSAGHARALLSLENCSQQEDLAERIIAEGLSVRATERAVAALNRTRSDKQEIPQEQSSQKYIFQQAEKDLSQLFHTAISVNSGKKKGKILIEFSSLEEFQRIMNIMKSIDVSSILKNNVNDITNNEGDNTVIDCVR